MSADKYYELKVAGSQVLLLVFPPEKGKRAKMGDIQRELQELGAKFMPENLFEVFRRASGDFEPVATRESKDYTVMLDLTPDAVEAYMTIIPPDIPGAKLRPEQIKSALAEANLNKGVLYDEIKRIMADKIEGERILIAQGQAPVHGEDGYIEFCIKESKGSTVDTNRVDFKEMNLIDNVEEGDLIARLLPPKRPEDGFDIHGNVLEGRMGKAVKLKAGKNVRRSEENTELFAKKSGFVVVSGDKISIEDIMRVSDVDAETGNIRYTGVVQVSGQVQDGFTVEADRGIQVTGTVGRATLKSGGDIHIHGGVIGATISSHGNVYARFISESTVQADHNIIANEYILHSTVLAHRSVIVEKLPSGFINGGLVQAGVLVSSPNIGSEVSEEKTQIEVGVGFGVKQRFETMIKKMSLERASFEKLKSQLLVLQSQKEQQGRLPQEKAESMKKMVQTAANFRSELMSQLAPFHELRKAIETSGDSEEEAIVFVERIVNSGTSIQINRHRVTINDALEYTAFRILGNQIKAQDFKDAQRAYKVHQKSLQG